MTNSILLNRDEAEFLVDLLTVRSDGMSFDLSERIREAFFMLTEEDQLKKSESFGITS